MEHDLNESSGRADRSSIAFPYYDLEASVDVAKSILRAGGVPLERDQLATAMNLSPSSGNFSVKLSAARLFGIVETVAGRTSITALGHEILDGARQQAASARAFLNVPLYRAIFDEFRGKQLPPRPHGIEGYFARVGVAPKQKDKARQVFERSARFAGFFPTSSEDRLVMPVALNQVGEDSNEEPAAPPLAQNPSHQLPQQPTGAQKLHPLIAGLLERLPAVDDPWPVEKRKKWLETAGNIFDLLYSDDGTPSASGKTEH